MRLGFKENEIEYWAERYLDRQRREESKREFMEEEALVRLRDGILNRRVLTRDELERVARWKSPRRAGDVKKNADDYVKAITAFALQTPSERARIEVLRVLDGVEWATASAILHLFHKDKYPILDFRALWSVSADTPSRQDFGFWWKYVESCPSDYNFDFWWKYVEFCRGIADRAGCTMRTLDRALWQHSSEKEEYAGDGKQEVP
jgi:hypothetical protein